MEFNWEIIGRCCQFGVDGVDPIQPEPESPNMLSYEFDQENPPPIYYQLQHVHDFQSQSTVHTSDSTRDANALGAIEIIDSEIRTGDSILLQQTRSRGMLNIFYQNLK